MLDLVRGQQLDEPGQDADGCQRAWPAVRPGPVQALRLAASPDALWERIRARSAGSPARLISDDLENASPEVQRHVHRVCRFLHPAPATRLPTVPLVVRGCARWKATTLARVVGPNTPSAWAAFRLRCRAAAAPLREPLARPTLR